MKRGDRSAHTHALRVVAEQRKGFVALRRPHSRAEGRHARRRLHSHERGAREQNVSLIRPHHHHQQLALAVGLAGRRASLLFFSSGRAAGVRDVRTNRAIKSTAMSDK